jgi:membrane associated rhomboid family serine protease
VSAIDARPAELRIPLRPGRGEVALHTSGFRHPSSRWTGAERFTGYDEITHLQVGTRQLRFGTRRGITVLPRRWFAESGGPERMAHALLERIAEGPQPRASRQLAEMAAAEALLRRPQRLRVTPVIAGLCLAVYALEVLLGPIVHHAGFMSPLLAAHGEPWRLVTANLLHADLAHLVFNVLGLLALGALVEWPLGALRTVLVLGLSGGAAMASAWLAGYEALVGASGMVAGLAGAVLWLEFRRPEQLPAGWRLPRRLFVGALLFDAMLPIALPFIAGAAHLTGFAVGVVAAAMAAGARLGRERLRVDALVAASLVLAVATVSIASAARFLVDSAAWEGHAARLLQVKGSPAVILNDAAWLIATADAPSRQALAHALVLAERAAYATRGLDPNILDTLAEAQWRSGDERAALETIEEAIALAPDEPYFREQRRRFTGERDADDRPDPPGWGTPPEPPAPWDDSGDPGISV